MVPDRSPQGLGIGITLRPSRDEHQGRQAEQKGGWGCVVLEKAQIGAELPAGVEGKQNEKWMPRAVKHDQN